MHRHCRHIYIAGQSMGGLLAIKAAADFPLADSSEGLFIKKSREDPAEKSAKTCSVEKLILLATPVFLQDWRVPFVKLLRYFIPRLHTGQHRYSVPEEDMQGYTEMPTKPVPSLLELIELCKADYLAGLV